MINYTKNTTTDNEVADVKQWLHSPQSKLFRKYILNEIAYNQAMAGKEASLNHLSDRAWEVNDHVKKAAELISFIRILGDYSQPEKELYKLKLEIDTNIDTYA